VKTLQVFLHGVADHSIQVGRLAYKDGLSHLELDKDFLDLGINISPVNLKLDSKLQIAPRAPFNGLHGVFADSLPDGWGLLLMDRRFRQRNIGLEAVTPLTRLAYMGDRAMGALSYQPDFDDDNTIPDDEILSLTSLAEDSLCVYEGSVKEVTERLHILGGSPGGARPKATIGLNGETAITDIGNLPANYEHWLVKFPTGKSREEQAEGTIEYIYSLMARSAGIQFPETRLIETHEGFAYFACKRFDRGKDNNRIHMHTLAAMINADFRIPDADYGLLMKVTSHVTKSHADMCEVLRRMIFNILSGNRDDHTKNFSFLMTPEGSWSLSPVYDVTFNTGVNGHHSMSIMGHGQKVPYAAIQKIADSIPLKKTQLNLMIDEIAESLSQWKKLAEDHNIPFNITKEIGNYIDEELCRIDQEMRGA